MGENCKLKGDAPRPEVKWKLRGVGKRNSDNWAVSCGSPALSWNVCQGYRVHLVYSSGISHPSKLSCQSGIWTFNWDINIHLGYQRPPGMSIWDMDNHFVCGRPSRISILAANPRWISLSRMDISEEYPQSRQVSQMDMISYHRWISIFDIHIPD